MAGFIDWERPLNEQETNFKTMLVEALPPIISRNEVSNLTGGWISPKTLRNDDSQMKGPRRKFISGRKVLYKCDELVEYGIRRFGIMEKVSLL